MSSGKRLALLFLVALFVLAAVRLLTGVPSSRSAIELRADRSSGLASMGFEALQAVPIVVHAVGSAGDSHSEGEMSVYGWILDESDRTRIWHMDAGSIDRNEDGLAIIESDTIMIEPGRYSAYLSSQADMASRFRRAFARNRDSWKIVVHAAEEDVRLRTASIRPIAEGADVFWSAAPLENDDHREVVFEVHRTAELEIYAIGQTDAEGASPLIDYSWIEDVYTGRPRWHFSLDNTEWAGGSRDNRMYRGTITLRPGVYRAVARTNGSHGFGDWGGHPPFDPWAWGLTLAVEEDGAVTRFDPWLDADRDPIISITRVGDDESYVSRFRVSRTSRVMIWALGEITGEDGLWDTAALSRITGGREVEIWSMDYQSSVHGGGGSKNRLAVKFLELAPGEYALSYNSDGSHSYADWNDDPPNHPERWGATLFPASDAAAVTVLQ